MTEEYITIYRNYKTTLQKNNKRKDKCEFENGDCSVGTTCKNAIDYIECNNNNCNNNASCKNRYFSKGRNQKGNNNKCYIKITENKGKGLFTKKKL